MDNVKGDPATGSGMLVTAENVAEQEGFTREEADELTLRRYEQYAESLANNRAFQKRFMFPVEATVSRKK
ncbi:MAG: thiolase family protein, partial [Bacillota bacterium]